MRRPTFTIARWLKSDGDVVRRGEAICEVETEQASVELPAWASGVLTRLRREGDRVGVGEPVARIEPG